MAMIEARGLTKTYRVVQKKDGRAGALVGLFRREYREVARRRWDQLHDRARRDGRISRAQRRGQDDDAQDAFRADLSRAEARRRCWASCRGSEPTPSGASSRWSWGRRTSSGGTCRPADSFELLREIYLIPPGRVSEDAGGADRTAGRREADTPGRARAFAGRADENGADRRASCTGRSYSCSTSRRSASTWSRRG